MLANGGWDLIWHLKFKEQENKLRFVARKLGSDFTKSQRNVISWKYY
jgi:hypothetical protein